MSEITARFDTLLRANDSETLYAELYAPTVVSVEANGDEYKGLEGIGAKNAWWSATFEVLESVIEGPFPHGESSFAYIYRMKTRQKDGGAAWNIDEVAVYDVEEGKIARERYFYTGGPGE